MNTIDYSAIAQPVLVTGADNFLGRQLVERLQAQGVKPRVLWQNTQELPADWPAGVECIEGDIGRRQDVERALRGVKTVFHLAAQDSDWGDEAEHRRITVGGTESVFTVAGAVGAHVVMATCASVYGDEMGRGAQCREEQPMGLPAGVYSESRQTQERIAWSHCARVHWSIVRPAQVYDRSGRLWGEDLSGLRMKRLPALVDGGKHRAGLVHIDTVLDLLLLCAYRREAKHQVFNAAEDAVVSWREYAADLVRLYAMPQPKSLAGVLARAVAPAIEAFWRTLSLRERPPVTLEALQWLCVDNSFSMDKARRLLAYEPQRQYRDVMNALTAAADARDAALSAREQEDLAAVSVSARA